MNKVETGVRALYPPLELVAVSTEERSQYMNKRTALQHLRDVVTSSNSASVASARALNRLEHTRLERGNPLRVYKGMEFQLVSQK